MKAFSIFFILACLAYASQVLGSDCHEAGFAYTSSGSNLSPVKSLKTWGDFPPVFALFDGNSCSESEPIPGSSGASDVVLSSYDPVSKRFLVTWKDNKTLLAYYAVLNGETLSWEVNATLIPSGKESNNIVFPCNKGGKFLVTWVGLANRGHYALFNGSTLTWDSPASLIPDANAATAIVSGSNSKANNFYVTWVDQATHYPFYSIFDGKQWSAPRATILSADGEDARVWPAAACSGPVWASQSMAAVPLPDEDSSTAQSDSNALVNDLRTTWPTITRVSASPNPAKAGDKVNLRARVRAVRGFIPRGFVYFFIGKNQIGRASLNLRGEASLTITSPAKTSLIRAIYRGSPRFFRSFGTVELTVTAQQSCCCCS